MVAFTWAGTRGVAFLADLANQRLGAKTGGAALAATTRIMVLRRVAGVVVVVLTIDAHQGEIVAGPDIVNRGFVFDEAAGDILEEARNRVMLSLKESAGAKVVDRGMIEQNIRRTLGKYFYEVTQRKPVILPVIMEV